MQWQIRLIFCPLQSCYHRLHISFPNFSLNVNWCRLLSQLLSCEWPSSSQHAVQWGPQHHASSHWKSSQVEGPIHSKLTLTGSDWIPLPLAASLTAAQTAGVSQSPSPLLQLSFTSTDMSDQCAFCSGRRNLCLSISFASLSVLFISFHSLPLLSLSLSPLSLPQQDEDICCASLIPVCFLFFSPLNLSLLPVSTYPCLSLLWRMKTSVILKVLLF